MSIACCFVVQSWYNVKLRFLITILGQTMFLTLMKTLRYWSCSCAFLPTLSWSYDEYEKVISYRLMLSRCNQLGMGGERKLKISNGRVERVGKRCEV